MGRCWKVLLSLRNCGVYWQELMRGMPFSRGQRLSEPYPHPINTHMHTDTGTRAHSRLQLNCQGTSLGVAIPVSPVGVGDATDLSLSR